MKQLFKILSCFLLLLSLTFSSVYGIVENKGVSLQKEPLGISSIAFQQHSSQASFHETFVEKEILLENEMEDDREEVFAEASQQFFQDLVLYSCQIDQNEALVSNQPISLNILYCVFRI